MHSWFECVIIGVNTDSPLFPIKISSTNVQNVVLGVQFRILHSIHTYPKS